MNECRIVCCHYVRLIYTYSTNKEFETQASGDLPKLTQVINVQIRAKTQVLSPPVQKDSLQSVSCYLLSLSICS